MTDEELFELSKRGSQKAMTELFNRHNRSLIPLVINIVGRTDIAQDVIGDVWNRLWLRKAKIDLKGSFRPYLQRMCYNRAKDYYRKEVERHRKLFENIDDVEERISDERKGEYQRNYRGFLDQQVGRILDESEVKIWKLWLKDYNNEEIAAVTSYTQSTVAKKKNTIKGKLIKGLNRKDYGIR